jgi:mercuric ion transport protein
MKERSLAIGSTLAAFLASLCCLGPLLLGGAGLGAALVATFGPLRPYFLAVSATLLAGGFYFVYRKPKAAEACAGETCAPQSGTRRMAKPLLWLATLPLLRWPSSRPMGITAEVKAGNCACEVKNPSGKCCLGEIARAAQGAVRALQEAGIAR